MEIYAPLCSKCNSDAEFVGESDSKTSFSCSPDCLFLSNAEPAQYLPMEQDGVRCLTQLQSLKSKLLKLKSQYLNSAETLTKLIHSCLQTTLKSIEQNIIKIDTNSQFVLNKKKIFTPILEILEKYQNTNFEVAPNFKIIESQIYEYFDRNSIVSNSIEYNGPAAHSRNIPESRSAGYKLYANYSLLVNKKLFDDKTSTQEKLEILYKTSFFENIDESSSNENRVRIENSKKIVLDLENNMIFTLSDYESIFYWKIQDKIRLYKTILYKKNIKDIFVIPRSNYILVHVDKFLAAIDLNKLDRNTGNMSNFTFQGLECGEITDLKVFPNSKYIATPAFEGKMKIWKLPDLDLVSDETICNVYFNGSISCFDISPDSESLAIGTVTGQIVLRDIFQKNLFRVSGHSGGVTAISFHPNLLLIVSGGEDNYIKVWRTVDFTSYYLRHKKSGMKIKQISFSIDFEYILTGCPKSIVLWRISDNALIKQEIKDKESLYSHNKHFLDFTRFLKFFR